MSQRIVRISIDLDALGTVPRRRLLHFPVRRDIALRAKLRAGLFASRGDLMLADMGKVGEVLDAAKACSTPLALTEGELFAIGVLHEIQHAIVGVYRSRTGAFRDCVRATTGTHPGAARDAVTAFLTKYPTPALYAALAVSVQAG